MAYSTTYGLTRQSNALGFYLDEGQVTHSQVSHWGYATADAAATVETSGYFNSAASLISKGDLLDAVMVLGGSVVRKSYIFTSANGASPVTIALQTTTAG